jgi:hypothetical protein
MASERLIDGSFVDSNEIGAARLIAKNRSPHRGAALTIPADAPCGGAMARKRKPARRGFKHTREFIDDNGKPDTYIERRGLREFKTPASKQARAKLLPRAQEEAVLLSIAALEILKRAGERTLLDVLESVRQAKPEDEETAIKAAVMAWDFDITIRYGILSPVTAAANFLAGVHSIKDAFVDRLTDKQADNALPDEITRRMQQVFAFADTWHLLHMEVYGQHRRAWGSARSAENLGAAALARAEKKKKRMEIVRRACEVYWTKHGRRNAAQTAERLYSDVRKTLETTGHQTYTRESFVVVVREIFRENGSQS